MGRRVVRLSTGLVRSNRREDEREEQPSRHDAAEDGFKPSGSRVRRVRHGGSSNTLLKAILSMRIVGRSPDLRSGICHTIDRAKTRALQDDKEHLE
jgi:hypothetical protein